MRPRSRHGITLAETLAALVLVAVVTPIALRAISTSLHTAERAADQRIAVELAQWKMDELIATGEWEAGILQGDFTQSPSGLSITTGYEATRSGMRFEWEANVEDWEEATEVQVLTITVTWERRGRSYATSLTTLVQGAGA